MARYDLDSMAFMSKNVVEGIIIEVNDTELGNISRLKVVDVYKGQFKKDDIVKVYLGGYAKHGKGTESNRCIDLEIGDRVFIFLVNVQWTPKRPDIFRPIPSGVKFISKKTVMGFSKSGNFGPVILQSDEKFSEYWIPLNTFRENLKTSITKANDIEEKFRAQPSEKEVDWLIDLLRERSLTNTKKPIYFDHISKMVCQRISQIQDPSVSAMGLQYVKPWSGLDIIRKSFGIPKGRDFLLNVIGNSEEVIEKKILYAGILADAKETYHLTYTCKNVYGDWRTSGKVKEGNAGYITKIAHLAYENVENDELCTALLESITSFAYSISRKKEEYTSADLNAAMLILEKVYISTKSDKARYFIEISAGVTDQAIYKKFNEKCGPIVSIIERPGYYLMKDKTRIISFNYIARSFSEKPIELTPYLVLEDTTTKKQYSLSLWEHRRKDYGPPVPPNNNKTHTFDSMERKHRGGSIVLPKDIPNGKYHIFLEYRNGKEVISQGHYHELEI